MIIDANYLNRDSLEIGVVFICHFVDDQIIKLINIYYGVLEERSQYFFKPFLL